MSIFDASNGYSFESTKVSSDPSTIVTPLPSASSSGVSDFVSQIPTSVQNFQIPSLQQMSNEVLLKLSATGITENFSSFSESVCKIPAALPDYVSSTASSFFPSYTNTDFSPGSINQALGKFSVPGRKSSQVMMTTEAQQLKELRKNLRMDEGSLEQTNEYKVKLTSTIDPDKYVIFEVTPTFSDTRSAVYNPLEIVHHPGQIQVYKTTESRSFQLQGRLISNTSAEAADNLIYINRIRSWVMPYYGGGTETRMETKKYFGAPPEVLWFSAYGKFHFEKIPVVVTSYSFTYDEQYDMIPANESSKLDNDGILLQNDSKTPVPMPVIMAFTVDIRESYSPAEFSSFDLREYREGNLVTAFLTKANK
jgi:hypothetical protein